MYQRVSYIRRGLCLFLWAIWFGGLTFYAGIVVPVGTDAIGATGQGFITQQVTIRLNLAACILLIFWLWEWLTTEQRSRRSLAIWVAHVALLLILTLLHRKLSGQLDFEGQSVPQSDFFYQWHRAYLLITTLQWLTGLAMGMEFLNARRNELGMFGSQSSRTVLKNA